MSGHNKWSKIQHKKGLLDAKKGKLFSKLSREIFIAISEGGSADPQSNSLLKLAVDKAKAASMPNSNIERAIKKAAGEDSDTKVERAIYEGYGPFGVALVIEVLTDNKNRTVANLRSVLSSRGGNLADSGSVLWQFARIALIICEKDVAFDEFFEAVSDIQDILDIVEKPDGFYITSTAVALNNVRMNVEKKGSSVKRAEIAYIPQNPVKVVKKSAINELIDALMDDEDVINVWHSMN